MTELKPCPFCGGEAVSIDVDYDPDAFNNITILDVNDLPF